MARIDEALPANLRYGCAVACSIPRARRTIHADQRDLFVIPTDRTIQVTTTVPDEVGPGAEINLGIEINRKEEVDLIVSVFDESLLGVSGDLSKNIRDFYLADARGQGRAARELAATRLGTVTIAELVKKAEELLKDKDRLAQEPGLEQQLTGLSRAMEGGQGRGDRRGHAGAAGRVRGVSRAPDYHGYGNTVASAADRRRSPTSCAGSAGTTRTATRQSSSPRR